MRDHNQLIAFQLADEIALKTSKITKQFPKEEIYGLVSQMRWAEFSVPSNIVEGCARESQTEYLRFLEIAFASLRDLHYHFNLAALLIYISESDAIACESKLEEMKKYLVYLLGSLWKSA